MCGVVYEKNLVIIKFLGGQGGWTLIYKSIGSNGINNRIAIQYFANTKMAKISVAASVVVVAVVWESAVEAA